MNEKATVSKQLNAKHRKILDGLLKLPENRECADCKARGPRWASVNLGIFICMQCCGIHRSLGVHISKVRSATLDTWLPEQITFIQSMGNEKSNSYWEAELPPYIGRVGTENFIRAKYQEKKWVPRGGNTKSPSKVSEEKASLQRTIASSSGHIHSNYTAHVPKEKIVAHPPFSNNNTHTPFHCPPATVQVTKQVAPSQKIQEPVPNSELSAPKSEPAKPEASTSPAFEQHKKQNLDPAVLKSEPPKLEASIPQQQKVDYATDLFNLLCMDDSRENDLKTSDDDKSCTSLQSANVKTAEPINTSKEYGSKIQIKYGIEDLFVGSRSAMSSFPEKSQKDVKNDTINLFGKPAILSKQQSFQAAASAKSSGGSQTFPANVHQPGSNGVYLPTQNWGVVGHQVPGIMTPIADQQNFVQMRNSQPLYPAANFVNLPTSSMYRPQPMVPINGTTNRGTTRPPPAAAISSIKDYDFSSLTQGMFAKR